jgi:class 3 adenylate cyclase/tetratricopeptide (TPR) repeat protein
MPCPECQHENPVGARFCNDCGAKLEASCPQCGQVNPPGSRFCNGCGQRLDGAGSPAPTAPGTGETYTPRFASPGAYTPQHLAERIISSRSALEGERKQVTVLFADLKGSMELLADRDPEEARRILDPVLEQMMDAVHHYEGTVNQVMGDGIMALFGAPLAHEDHAVRACYAALRMQQAVNDYADEVWRSQNIRVQVRVGLNSGEVVVRSISSDLRMDYTAVGQTTHLAARMEQLATPGSILLAPATLHLAEGYIQVRPLGPVQVKGLRDPVAVYELIGAGTARSRLQAAASRGLTKFVGRDAELETLRRTLEQAGSGHGQVVALVGEPGVGKSRLVWEFSHSHRTAGWLVLASGSVSYGKATSYLPVIDLLKSYCGIESRDDQRRIREKLLGKVLNLDEALRPALPALLALLDMPTEDPGWEALDPPQRRQRTLDACKRLVLRESQEQPLLLVFEDLHWIDSETQALLDYLVESLPSTRLLLLVNYRPEYEHAWHRKTYYQQLRLDPLPPASAEELLQALVGDDASLHELRRLLVERTEGNPFFLEESVQTLVEQGALVGERGRYTLARPLDSTQVPATVQAVLAARLDRLAPEDKRLLQAAAVIGKDVPFALLQAVAELREDWLRQGLADLHAAEFLYETSLFPDLEYTFKHALTHEVAYGSLLQDRRRALHARIMEAMERLYPDRLAEHVERLAHHAVRGERWEKAVDYLRRAGAKAAARSAYREAATCLEQALVALEHQRIRPDYLEWAVDLRLDLRNALLPVGELDRMGEHLREAEGLAERLGDQRRLGWICAYQCHRAWQMGEHVRAAELGRRAVALADAQGDLGIQVEATFRLGLALLALGSYDEAKCILQQTVAALQGARAQERFGLSYLPAVAARVWLARALSELGEIQEGIAVGAEALCLAQVERQPYDLALAAAAANAVYLLQGDFAAAIPILEQGLEAARTGQIALIRLQLAPRLAYAYALAGRTDEAIRLFDEAAPDHADIVSGRDAAQSFSQLADGYLLAGQHSQAQAVAERLLARSESWGERGNAAWALRCLGDIGMQAEPPRAEEAEGYYRRALALGKELQMRPLVAHCHLGLGTIYQKIGRDDEARNELTTAAELYRAMEMPFWLEQAETTLEQVAG